WKIFDGALNADILIDFMQRLIRGAKTAPQPAEVRYRMLDAHASQVADGCHDVHMISYFCGASVKTPTTLRTRSSTDFISCFSRFADLWCGFPLTLLDV
ncbi:hypothetical protein, partial [Burkholderia ubonensis]|uniref:hypothetical protein n=1 Tax=Burkholderia ubonensis TaxID=101571 RepID=UPI0012FAA3C4